MTKKQFVMVVGTKVLLIFTAISFVKTVQKKLLESSEKKWKMKMSNEEKDWRDSLPDQVDYLQDRVDKLTNALFLIKDMCSWSKALGPIDVAEILVVINEGLEK